jgi:hypothetical protein
MMSSYGVLTIVQRESIDIHDRGVQYETLPRPLCLALPVSIVIISDIPSLTLVSSSFSHSQHLYPGEVALKPRV